MKKDRLEHLDGIRGIAAFSVIFGHIKWPSAIAHLPFFTSTTLWVDFFFVLSGFVMARSYFDRLSEGMTVGKFMWRRFARLYPLHLVTLLAALAYELLKWGVFSSTTIDAKHVPFENNNVFSFACTALLIHALGILPASYWNGPSWSISAEFYVYLVFAICVVFARNKRSLFWKLLIGLQLLSFATLAICSPQRSVETDYGFFRCMLGFGLGVAVEHFCRGRQIPEVSPKSWLNILMAVLVFTLICVPVEGTYLPLISPFVFGVAVWLLVQYRGGIVERILNSRICQSLGVLSYSLYMTHGLFAGMLKNVWKVLQKKAAFHSGLGAVLLNEGLTIILMLIVLLVARICFRYIEMPAQTWLNKLGDRPKREPNIEVAVPGAATY